jgi:hypothetical protein
MESPVPVEIVGWSDLVLDQIDRAEDLARLGIFAAVLIGAFCIFLLAWIAVQGLRR